MEMEQWDDGNETLGSHYFDDYEDTDNEYNIIEALTESRLNAQKLEKKIDKIRHNIINICKNKNPNNLYELKINYTEIADQLEKETSTFNELLKNLDESDFLDMDSTNNNHKISEIFENTSVHSDSYISHEQQLFDDDINSFTEEIPSHNPSPQKNEEINAEIQQNTLDWNFSVESTADSKQNIIIEEESNKKPHTNGKSSNARKRRLRRKKAILNSMTNIRPKTAADSKLSSKSKPTTKPKRSNSMQSLHGKKMSKHMRKNTTKTQIQSRPQMDGRAIYSSTLLFCKETCNGNENALREYLIDCGKFTNDMIENIMFKEGNYNNYALVRVRADMKCINEGIEGINSFYHYDAIQIFKRYKNINDDNMKACTVLYVNYFDILGKNTVKKFTKLFLEKGELERDIKMGIDRVNDPYAIVHFKKVKDAKKCVESKMIFGGKVLSIKYSKFG